MKTYYDWFLIIIH